ncbi:hypothetical protein M409DRAFT_18049 [Zasmidium cellare ATCC 36951]|uniref:SnoaL-like domain-containing protein n=1 Tax=Zasmidium cellare ATCC 36951 TaxID=1080233 RepID=A0A6A6D2F7_ZASCE|nr:uncharacterized protein M409DRAFT_18049 [Zasmidium cellare ATCC 36951]KAF2171816.1 hypothetical protein M409DRAFT_18049 [Zasmidium cellare ATCC 36951]
MASAVDTQGGSAPQHQESPLATKKPDRASEKMLKELTELFITDVSAYDDAEFLQHVSPDFQWNIVGSFLGRGRKAHFEKMKEIRQAHPDYHVNILNISAEVQIGKAKTWALMKISGFPEGVERESILMFSWRRDVQGTWVCYRHDGIRGVAPMPFLVSKSTPLDDG